MGSEKTSSSRDFNIHLRGLTRKENKKSNTETKTYGDLSGFRRKYWIQAKCPCQAGDRNHLAVGVYLLSTLLVLGSVFVGMVTSPKHQGCQLPLTTHLIMLL